MEAAGLAIGVIGLAGLFSSCFEAVDKAQSYFSFGTDSQVLNARFKAAKVRLEKWGQRVGFRDKTLANQHHPALGQQDVCSAVKDVLQIISTVCGAYTTSGGPFSLAPGHIQNPSLGLSEPQPLQAKRRRKLTWALGGKAKRNDQIQLLETLVQQLHNLVPPEETEGSRASPAELQQLVTRIKEMLRAETKREIHSWLGNSSPNDRYEDSIQKKLDGTCDWIFDRPQFKDWLDLDFSSDTKLLWINGPAGFGKTVLCARIVEHLSSTLTTPLGHLFFSSELENREDPFLAIKQWVFQLISHNEIAFEHVRRVWEQDSDQVLTRLASTKLLTQLLHIVPNCTLIADGLDECTHLDNSDVSVERFLGTLTAAISGTKTRILLVSRDEPQIRYAISEACEGLIEYKITPNDVRSDTAMYSREIVDRKLPNKSDILRSELSTAMTDRCEGQFLWLKIQEESLRRGMSQKQLRNTVDKTPTGLDAVYGRNWNRITNSPDCERTFSLLRWAAFTLRPLSVEEITEAVLIDESQEDLLMDDFPDAIDDDYVDSEIVGLCGPLVEIRSPGLDAPAGKRTVHLTHFSVRQFLLSSLPVPEWISANERLTSQYHNTMLAKACLYYISIPRVFKEAMNYPSFTGIEFYTYAALMWHVHIKKGLPHDKEVLTLAANFLDQKVVASSAWSQWRQDENPELKALEPTYVLSPLGHAVELDLPDVVQILITERNYDARATDGVRWSPLEIVCILGLEEVLKVLLDAKVSISAFSGWYAPLLVACHYGHLGVIKLLLENEASFTEARDGETAQAGVGHSELARAPIEKGKSVSAVADNRPTPLIVAIAAGHSEVTRLLSDHGADINTADPHGTPPLHIAALRGDRDVVKLLLDKGANLMERIQSRDTPLHLAVKAGRFDVAKLLINEGADVNLPGDSGMTPLSMACSKQDEKMTRMLFMEGGRLDMADDFGMTPLDYHQRWIGSMLVKYTAEKMGMKELGSGIGYWMAQ